MVVVQRKNTEMEITSEFEERLSKLCLSYDQHIITKDIMPNFIFSPRSRTRQTAH